MNEIVLDARNVTKQFGGLTAVDNVSIHLNKGEILGLIGANGAGKTTLFNMLSGSFPVTSGEIIYKNQDISMMPAHKVCALGIGRTYQIVQPFTNLSVIDNVMVGTFLHHPKAAEAREKAEEILRLTGLYDVKDAQGNNLTLTQMKRMEVAKALATEPDILLLDEVNAGLTPKEHPAIIQLISDIRDSGLSLIIIEHVMKVIMGVSDRIYVLNQGKLIAEGLPSEVVDDPEVIKSYFGEKANAKGK